jgi:hypothetical protein
LKKIEQQRRFRANVQAGTLQRDFIERRSEFFSNMDAEHWNGTPNELATEMMRSIEEKTIIRYSERLYYRVSHVKCSTVESHDGNHFQYIVFF